MKQAIADWSPETAVEAAWLLAMNAIRRDGGDVRREGWHAVAREGAPPMQRRYDTSETGGDGSREVHERDWRDGEWSCVESADRVDSRRVTHWWPVVKPAPPRV